MVEFIFNLFPFSAQESVGWFTIIVRIWNHKIGENLVTECGERESERIRESIIEGENAY